MDTNLKQQLDGLPTLVKKLESIGQIFATDDDTLKQVVRKERISKYKKQWPLFTPLVEVEIPEISTLSDMETNIYGTGQSLWAEQYYDYVIEGYSNNPLIAGALEGHPIYKRFKKDFKTDTTLPISYFPLIGKSDSGGIPDKSIVAKLIDILRGKVNNSTDKQLQHPIIAIDNKISKFNQRRKIRKSWEISR